MVPNSWLSPPYPDPLYLQPRSSPMFSATVITFMFLASKHLQVDALAFLSSIVRGSSPLTNANHKPAAKVATILTMSSSKHSTSQNETVGQMLGGLVFLKTADRISIVDFYTRRLGMTVWLEQPNITILNHGNMILGFHQIQNSDDQPDLQGMYTFVYPSREHVDDIYSNLEDIADGKPRHNERYSIYQFFAQDPEGRNLEFQAFLHPLTDVSSKVTT